jgi:hypothetical protein
MNARRSLLIATTVLFLGTTAVAADLEMSIRTHAPSAVFCDPLYIEVTIVNRGTDVVSVPPTFHSDHLRFEFSDPETGLVISKLDAAGSPSPLRFEPGESATFYKYLFAPDLRLVSHPFWKPIRGGKTIYISAVYGLRRGIFLTSNRQEVYVEARDDEEMRTLERWAWAELRRSAKGPKLTDFGVQFLRPLNHEHTLRIADSLQPGELADLVDLSIQVQEIYATPPQFRDPGDQALVEWLRKQPHIKRQALIQATWSVIAGNNMPSTEKVLQPLLNNR